MRICPPRLEVCRQVGVSGQGHTVGMKKTLLSVATFGLSLGLISAPAHATPKISAQSIIVNPVRGLARGAGLDRP